MCENLTRETDMARLEQWIETKFVENDDEKLKKTRDEEQGKKCHMVID